MMHKGKILISLLALICLCFFVTGCGEKTDEREDLSLEQAQVAVSVTDGVAAPKGSVYSLSVAEDGGYTFYINCKPDKEGILTGCVVYDEEDWPVFCCTGEEMQVESQNIELKAGTYRVEFCYLTNQNDVVAFLKNGWVKPDKIDPYTFSKNGDFNIHLEYGLEKSQKHSMYYYLGVICGFLFAFLIIMLVRWGILKTGGRIDLRCKADSYDERQQLARGIAYKRAFFALLFYIAVVSALSEMDISIFMSFAGMWLGVCIALLVFVITCIVHDAYMSLYENAKGVTMLISSVGVLNILCGFEYLTGEKPILEDGVIAANCVNLMVGITFLIIVVVFVGRLRYNKKQWEEDGE
ncbi:MAG: hypothetical protein K2G89_07465 [Lachnospiraceae bacterium]|nr:hypothetical protein [Lachnospiraceae bacterium]